MILGGLADALRRLDALLVRVCDAEETRAKRMYTEERGWTSLRASLTPSAAELAYDLAVPETGLTTSGAIPALSRLVNALELAPIEADVLIVLLAPHVEARYAKLYTVLQDEPATTHITERLLFTILGRSPARAAEIAAALSEDGRLCGAGLIARASGWYAARARPIDLAADVRDAMLGLPRPQLAVEHELAWRTGTGALADEPAAVQVVWGAGELEDVAATIAGPGLVILRLEAIPPAGTIEAAWRTAIAYGAALLVDVTASIADEAARIAGAIHRLVRRRGGSAVIASTRPLAIPVRHHHAPAPAFAARRADWADAARARGAALTEREVERLAANHPITARQIAEVFSSVAGIAADELNQAAHRLRAIEVRHARAATCDRTFADLVLRSSTREEFPFPDADERREIWQLMLAAAAPHDLDVVEPSGGRGQFGRGSRKRRVGALGRVVPGPRQGRA